MPTTQVKPRRRGINPKRLTAQQMVFLREMAADLNFNATNAVKKAFPKNKSPSAYAGKLMSQKKIQIALGKVLQERLTRLELKADDVLEYLRNILYFNPLEYFRPGKDGKWLITDSEDLPDWVGRLIDKMKLKVIEKNGSTTSIFEVELVSKATALVLAMKHVGVEKIDVTHNVINWDSLHTPVDIIDPVEQRLLEHES